jgi:hypothetical protein
LIQFCVYGVCENVFLLAGAAGALCCSAGGFYRQVGCLGNT